MSLKHVYESVAAQLDCDYKLIRDHVLHVTDQYMKLISDIREGDAQVEAAGEHAQWLATSICCGADPWRGAGQLTPYSADAAEPEIILCARL